MGEGKRKKEEEGEQEEEKERKKRKEQGGEERKIPSNPQPSLGWSAVALSARGLYRN